MKHLSLKAQTCLTKYLIKRYSRLLNWKHKPLPLTLNICCLFKEEDQRMKLTVILPSFAEVNNLQTLLPKVVKFTKQCTRQSEIIVVEGDPVLPTKSICKKNHVTCLKQKTRGFGNALKEGFKKAKGKWVITLDADGSHNPAYLPILWQQRHLSDLVIASRYMHGGFTEQNLLRSLMSKTLNCFARNLLDMPLKDISGGFKLYRKSMLQEFDLISRDFNIQIEAVVKSYAFGYKVTEIPFHFHDRINDQSRAKILTYGVSFARSIFRLWRMRNTVYFADYDLRAFRSRLLPQRMWHRKRYNISMSMLSDVSPTLEIGCGTGRMFFAHPDHIGLDIDIRKVRFLSQFNYQAMLGDARKLPFPKNSFPQVICQEVIEHVADSKKITKEIARVLKPKGNLVLSTPDYGKSSFWPPIEKIYEKVMPHAYAEEHITHYTETTLRKELEKAGFTVKEVKRAYNSILHVRAVKNAK